MASFRDSLDYLWEVEINGGSVKRAKNLLGIDLGRPTAGDPPWLTRFETDIAFKVDLLYVILRPQVVELGWSEEEFAGLLGGEVLREASVAVYQAMTDFFLHLGDRTAAIAIQSQVASVPEVYAEHSRRSQIFLARILGSLCVSSPALPDATQNGERFANSN